MEEVEEVIKNPLSTEEIILKKYREFHKHENFEGRAQFGEYHHLFPVLKKYPEKFRQYMRMSLKTFNYLLTNLKEPLAKKWCNLHSSPILQEEQLVITLRYASRKQFIINYLYCLLLSIVILNYF